MSNAWARWHLCQIYWWQTVGTGPAPEWSAETRSRRRGSRGGAEGTCARHALWEQPNWLTSPQRGSRQRCCAASRHLCLPRVPAVKTRLCLLSNGWTQDFDNKFKIKSRRHVFWLFLFCTCRIRTVLNKLQLQNYLLFLPVLITKWPAYEDGGLGRWTLSRKFSPFYLSKTGSDSFTTVG